MSSKSAAQLLLENEPARKVFGWIHDERSIQHRQLVDSVGEPEKAVEDAVQALQHERLIRFTSPASLPSSFRSYVVTPEGLSTARMLRRSKL